MTRLRPGWLVTSCALALSVCAWLPWLTTSAHGGGRASVIGGTFGSITLPPHFGPGQLIVLLAAVLIVLGALVAREISPRLAATAAVVISLLVMVLTWWFYRVNVSSPIAAGYGLYLGAVWAVGSLACSVWALVATLREN
ncbi:MAG: hypothetical protein KDB50_02400 [Mycobacterium sp.]|nr:hypothetical protein [Mycobacterium sp.]